jgi:hypothetical protein
MRRRGIACGLLALAALSCAPAAAAGAAQRPPSAPRLLAGVSRLNEQLALIGQGTSALGLAGERTLSELRFRNRDGYTISVLASGQTVALDVSRARFAAGRGGRKVRERASETTYLAHGRVTRRSITASFGELGRIAVRFQPGGREIHATRKAGCKRPDDAVIAELGSFEGTLSFRGEGGYTSVEAQRLPGRTVDLTALLACLLGVSPKADAGLPQPRAPLGIRLPGPIGARDTAGPGVPSTPTHPGSGPRSTALVADRKEALARLVFAAKVRGAARPRFLAVDQASAGSVGIVRLAYVRGAAHEFSFDDSLSSATVQPPPPFHGSAELRRGLGNAKSWSGPLAVSFLGAPDVPLTGAPFSASLSQGF